tara:strand:+ start:1656 stop:2918 length:1263 start_codon:yes stop_codon:yes gene_type:complete
MYIRNKIVLVIAISSTFAAITGCNTEVIEVPVNDQIKSYQTANSPVPSTPGLPEKSLELLGKIESLEDELKEYQASGHIPEAGGQGTEPDSNNHTAVSQPISKTEQQKQPPKTSNNINASLSPKITILNYSSYSTKDINKWVSYAESKMASRKSNILAWIYPVGDLVLPEQEVEGMPFIKHEVVLRQPEINTLMNDIEAWLKSDDCMGSRSRRDHLKEELIRFQAWFEHGADVSTQVALCDHTRIVAMGITENMREREPLMAFQDFLIHEFYHAFQQDLAMEGQCENKRRQPESNTPWFVEGAAQYFSMTVLAEIYGSDYPFRSALDRMLEIAWEIHHREKIIQIDGNALDKTGAIGLQLLIEKGVLNESQIMDASLFHNCARELEYDKNSPEIQHIRSSWYLIEQTNEGFKFKPEAYIP